MNGGKLKYKTPEEMKAKLDEYFAITEVPTMSGVAYHLGFSREALREYKDRDGFLPVIQEARQKVEIFLEQKLLTSYPTGAIFNLKNNFGWKDKHENELSLDEKTLKLIISAKDDKL